MLGRVGRYELLKRLAAGGMAEVFLACLVGQGGFSKIVALKRILPELAPQQQFVQMFLDEARVAARFNHPSIVQIFDLGQAEDHYFIAMEYIHGEDVKSIISRCARKKVRLPAEHSVKIISTVLDGLAYAHTQKTLDESQVGVVHRDVSPHNIIVGYHGGVKLIDFGIAKARTEISAKVSKRVQGKLAYLSPEQIRCEELDGRSDVFSAGIVLYELLTWTRLFKRAKPVDTLRAVCLEPIDPPRDRNPDLDPRLEAIVLRALAKDRERRYQTALEMQADLEDHLIAAGLRTNPALIGEWVGGLFSDKLEKQQQALSTARAGSLNSVFQQVDDGSPDLGAFLDMFFSESTSASYRTSSLPGLHPPGDPRMGAAPARGQPGVDIDIDFSDFDSPEASDAGLSERELLETYAAELDPLGTGRRGTTARKLLTLLALLLVMAGVIAAVTFSSGGDRGPLLGKLVIVSTPPGAAVSLNGVPQEGLTPMEIAQVPVGVEQALVVSLPGRPAWKSVVSVVSAERPLRVSAVLSGS